MTSSRNIQRPSFYVRSNVPGFCYGPTLRLSPVHPSAILPISRQQPSGEDQYHMRTSNKKIRNKHIIFADSTFDVSEPPLDMPIPRFNSRDDANRYIEQAISENIEALPLAMNKAHRIKLAWHSFLNFSPLQWIRQKMTIKLGETNSSSKHCRKHQQREASKDDDVESYEMVELSLSTDRDLALNVEMPFEGEEAEEGLR